MFAIFGSAVGVTVGSVVWSDGAICVSRFFVRAPGSGWLTASSTERTPSPARARVLSKRPFATFA